MNPIERLKEAVDSCHDGAVTREIVEEIIRASLAVQAAGGVPEDKLEEILRQVPTNYDMMEEYDT